MSTVSRHVLDAGYELVTAPAAEPITLTEAKEHLNRDASFQADDAYIRALIASAREWCEDYQQRAYMTQTWKLWLDEFPAKSFKVPKPPLQSITHIKYYDTDDAVATVATTVYRANTSKLFGEVALRDGKTWPSTTLRVNQAVEVQFVAGYGGASSVPQRWKQAILILLAHWYENREPISKGMIASQVRFTLEALLAQGRVNFV